MATMLKLYEEVDALQVVLTWMDEHEDEIAAAGGELPPALLELLEEVEGSLLEKIERTALVVQNIAAMAKAAGEEAKRLSALSTTYERQAEGLKGYIFSQMRRAGIQKHEGARAKLWIQANGRASVRLADPSTIPEQWQRVRVEFDGQAAYEYLKKANAIPTPEEGAVELEGLVIERGTHLRIK